MKILMVLIAVLLLASPACSQSLVSQPATFASLAPHIFLWAGTTADLATTIAAVRHGAREANPLMGQRPAQEIAVGYGLTAFVELAARHQDSKVRKRALCIIGAMHFGLASLNLRYIR